MSELARRTPRDTLLSHYSICMIHLTESNAVTLPKRHYMLIYHESVIPFNNTLNSAPLSKTRLAKSHKESRKKSLPFSPVRLTLPIQRSLFIRRHGRASLSHANSNRNQQRKPRQPNTKPEPNLVLAP